MKSTLLLLITVILLFLANCQTVWSMSSTNYSINWLLPMTGGGNRTTLQSANYSMSLTYGQTVTGQSSSPNSSVYLGFWAAGNGAKAFPWVLFYPAFTKPGGR